MYYEAVKGANLNILEESGDCGVLSAGTVLGKDKLCTAGSKHARFPHNEMFGILYGTEEGKLDEWCSSDVRSKVLSIQ